MAARGFNIARTPAGAPITQQFPYKTGESIVKGSLVLMDANGELTLAGADPTVVLGVAMQKAGSGPGWDAADSPLVITGRNQNLIVALAGSIGGSMVFSGRAVNGGTDPVLPLATHRNESYGVANSGGIWYIDIAETSAKVVTIVDIDATQNIMYFVFIQAVCQLPLNVDAT